MAEKGGACFPIPGTGSYPLRQRRQFCRAYGESAPLLAAWRDRLLQWKAQLLPKHPMAEAVGYVLNQWDELTWFLNDVPIDKDASEREMKRIVLNRKNSLFVGNERGGKTAAVLSSLTSTCFRHAIDPQRYLTHLLVNLPSFPVTQLEAWLPDQWKITKTTPPASRRRRGPARRLRKR